MTCTTELFQWVATSSSEMTGKEKKGVGVDLYVRVHFDCPDLSDGYNRAEYLRLRTRGKTN